MKAAAQVNRILNVDSRRTSSYNGGMKKLALAMLVPFLLAAGEKEIWEVTVPSWALPAAAPIAATLDVVRIGDRDGAIVYHLWETAERAAPLADLAIAVRTLPLALEETDHYRDHDEMVAAMHAIEERLPSHAKVYDIGRSVEDRPIYALKLSVSPAENLPGPPEVIIVGLHHAREWISGEVALRIAEYLADHIADGTPRIGDIVEGAELWFVPILNPDGYIYSHTTDRMWRENRRLRADGVYGVDINRNYDAAWAANGDANGTGPFSEPETRALRDLVTTPQGGTPLTDLPRGILTYHSYTQLLLYPWSSTADPAPTRDLMRATGERMAAIILASGGETYGVKQTSELYGVPIYGECTEWFYNATAQGTGFTVELRPANVEGGGFQLDPAFIEPTARESIASALYFIETILNGTLDIDTDANKNGEIDYLEIPDAPPDEAPDDDILLDEPDDPMPTDEAEPVTDDGPIPADDDQRPTPHPATGGCALMTIG